VPIGAKLPPGGANAPSGRKISAVASFCSEGAFGAAVYPFGPLPAAITELAAVAGAPPFT